MADPQDWAARARLARLHLQEGVLGAALQELDLLERAGELEGADRQALARLLVQRSDERLALGDALALQDRKRARALGAGEVQLGEAAALAALVKLRHSSQFEQEDADALLELLPDEADARRAYDRYEELQTEDLLLLFHWFADAGAKRRALEVAQALVDSGYRGAELLGAWQELHSWWFGSRRPLLPSEAALRAGRLPSAIERFELELGRARSLDRAPDPSVLALDWGLVEAAPVQEVLRAYRKDPALGEREARAFIDASVYGARELALMSELFFRLGDSARSRVFAEELSALSPSMPAFALAAALACAADGDMPRADQYLILAAAASGDPGRYWSLAAGAYLALGEPLPVIAAARKALGLLAPGRDLLPLLHLYQAQRWLGRHAQAETTRAALLGRLPEDDRSSASALINSEGPKQLGTLLGPFRDELGFASSSAVGSVTAR